MSISSKLTNRKSCLEMTIIMNHLLKLRKFQGLKNLLNSLILQISSVISGQEKCHLFRNNIKTKKLALIYIKRKAWKILGNDH